jgi:hypothetical protein
MATQKQLLANRLNAKKSTGPSTDDGKARSSMNALKTGIDAKTQLIRGEIWTDLQELIGEYHDRFRPTTPDQRLLVDILIDCDWLLRRFRAIETQLWEKAYHIFDITLAQAFTDKSDEFTRLQRRIDSTQRHYHNALNQLRRLQAEEAKTAPASEPDPATAPVTAPASPVLATPQDQTPNPANGFVPQPAPRAPGRPPAGDPLEGAPAAPPRPPANRPAPRI